MKTFKTKLGHRATNYRSPPSSNIVRQERDSQVLSRKARLLKRSWTKGRPLCPALTVLLPFKVSAAKAGTAECYPPRNRFSRKYQAGRRGKHLLCSSLLRIGRQKWCGRMPPWKIAFRFSSRCWGVTVAPTLSGSWDRTKSTASFVVACSTTHRSPGSRVSRGSRTRSRKRRSRSKMSTDGLVTSPCTWKGAGMKERYTAP
jgi:hypothetical protein